MNKHFILIIVLLLFASNILVFSQKSNADLPAIAVLPFKGIDENDGDTLARRLGTAFTEIKDLEFRILPRTKSLDKVLEEHSFQDKGITSTSNKAAIGKGLGADYIATVDLETLGNKKIAIASMIDVEDVRISAGYYFEYEDINNVLDNLPTISKVLVDNTINNMNNTNYSIAVLPFSIKADGLSSDSEAQVLAQMLAADIANSGIYMVAERTDTYEELEKEHERRKTGLLDERDLPKKEQGINADYVLAGFVTKLFNKPSIDIQILTSETLEQIKGTEIDFTQIGELVGKMPQVSYELTGVKSKSYIRANVSSNNVSIDLDYLLDEYEGKNGIEDIRKLLENGVNIYNSLGITSLILASHYGYTDVAQALIDAGANVNLQDNDKWTALMYASRYGHSGVVDLLIDAKANVSIVEYGDYGRDAYVLAKYGANRDDIANKLVDAGARRKIERTITSSSFEYRSFDWQFGWGSAGFCLTAIGIGITGGAFDTEGAPYIVFRDPEPINDIFGNQIGWEFDPSSKSSSRGMFYGGIATMTVGVIFLIVGLAPYKSYTTRTYYSYETKPKNNLSFQPYIVPDLDGSIAMGLNLRYKF